MWITKVVWRLPGRQMSIVAEIHFQNETPRQDPIFHPMSDTESRANRKNPEKFETQINPKLWRAFPQTSPSESGCERPVCNVSPTSTDETRASHLARTLCDLNTQTTVTSVNGVSVRPQFLEGNNGFRHFNRGNTTLPRAHMPELLFRMLVEGQFQCHNNLQQNKFASSVRRVGKSGARSKPHSRVWKGSGVPGGTKHQDVGHPDGPTGTCARILRHLSDKYKTCKPDPLDRKRAKNFAPPGSLCGGENDMFVMIRKVSEEERPGHVRILKFHSARQPRGLGRSNEGHRPVANIFWKFRFL